MLAAAGEAINCTDMLLPVWSLIAVVITLLFFRRRRASKAASASSVNIPPDNYASWNLCDEDQANEGANWEFMGWLLANGVEFHPAVRVACFSNPFYLDDTCEKPMMLRGMVTTGCIEAGGA